MTEDRLYELMVTVVDGVASPADREELMAYIADKPELRRELEAHQALKAVTDGWVERLELDLVEDRMREQGTNTWINGLGVALFLGSVSLLTGWGLVEGMLDDSAPLVVRLALGGLGASFLLLLVGAFRWWNATRKVDRYSEVIR
ncbi:MAG: hypothetical protein EP330_31180 [Deltaproteobacteria bacterium]|nr:MAG: hypothetical protein EP330_31180 [Deltaproteobacteria bacterium]